MVCVVRRGSRPFLSRVILGTFTVAIAATAISTGCGRPEMVLTQVVEVRALSADLLVQLNKATGASDRAVLADTDDASKAAAAEAKEARYAIKQGATALAPLLERLGYADEHHLLDEFNSRFSTYEALDDTILTLAVENTNLKAQRLSFGPEREAADAFRAALETVLRDVPRGQATRAEAIVARAEAEVFEVQAAESRHIAESDEGRMSALEAQMDKAMAAAHAGLKSLEAIAPASTRPSMTGAAAALDKVETSHAEVVRLSRRNTNVQSTALALGRKRTISAGCEQLLTQLSEALATHEFKATR
jgi:hypothetical protein